MDFRGTKWRYLRIADMDFQKKALTESMALADYLDRLKRRADCDAQAREIEEDGRIIASTVLELTEDGTIATTIPLSACSPKRLEEFRQDPECTVGEERVKIPHDFGRWQVREGCLYFGDDVVTIEDGQTISLMGGMFVFRRIS